VSKRKPAKAGTKTRRINAVALVLSVIAIVIVAYLAGRQYFGTGGPEQQAADSPAPAIGGPFTLVDQNGKTVTDADFRGRYMLIYFGYTFCPDVCPTALTRNSDALDLMGKAADKIVPIFITVDPERDTAENMKEYAGFFHPRLLALTGTPEQVAAAAKAYRVYYAKVQEKGADADDYLMDHTSITYLMGPDGKFLSHFGHDVSPERMAERLTKIVGGAGG
jgi:protein SCO1/2